MTASIKLIYSFSVLDETTLMATKLLFSVSLIVISVVQPAKGYSAFAKASNTLPGNRHSCHSHRHYHYHDNHYKGFFREKNKNVTSWGAFFDYLCIGPVGVTCGIIGIVKRESDAGLVMAVGIIETALAAACLSR